MDLMSAHHHLSEVDADQEAIDDLTRQVKGQRGPMADLIRSRRDQLQAEVQAEAPYDPNEAQTYGSQETDGQNYD